MDYGSEIPMLKYQCEELGDSSRPGKSDDVRERKRPKKKKKKGRKQPTSVADSGINPRGNAKATGIGRRAKDVCAICKDGLGLGS